MSPSLNRREAIAALLSTATWPLMSGCTREPGPTSTATATAETAEDARQRVDLVADTPVGLGPEGATSLGIHTGARAELRSQLSDRSGQGQQQIANLLRTDLDRVKAFNTSGLSHAMRT